MSNGKKIRSNQADPEIHFIDENQITVFESYTLRTPSKLTGSAAFVFGKIGLLSFDYNYQDFDNIELRPSSDFNATNQFFGTNLKGASSFKVGGELRAKNWSFRGGYRFEESPYKNENVMGDLTGFSLGFGYNFGRTKFDLAYSRSSREMQHDVFEIDSATIDQVNSQINATLMFSFF